MQFQFSNDVAKLQPSAIREILKFGKLQKNKRLTI